MTKSGFVSLTGRTNVGKSTLLNQILGQKVAITSNKPQTTRTSIRGVYTQGDCQIVFVDTPGFHQPVHKLGEKMLKEAEEAAHDVDMVLMVAEVGKPRPADLEVAEYLKQNHLPAILVLNKTDLHHSDEVILSIEAFKDLYDFMEIVPVSARTGRNVDELLKVIISHLEEGPFFYPEDQLTDQPERQMVAELIREKTLKLLNREVPHGIAVTIDDFKEREDRDIVDIHATIICEKASHKPIIIGHGGERIKKIGTYAREDAEKMLGEKVNLQLFVKVKERWRDSDYLIKNYGLDENAGNDSQG